jgi:acyl-coenzyme A synthetase/AMP-(fatty) acid ligase
MKTQPGKSTSLWDALSRSANLDACSLSGPQTRARLGDLAWGSSLGGRLEELRGRSVLIATRDQVVAALAMIELDGLARRIVLCPPDLAREHLQHLTTTGDVDTFVVDRELAGLKADGVECLVVSEGKIERAECDRSVTRETEWILTTSSTTGAPKMVEHTLLSLTGPIGGRSGLAEKIVWSTFYDIRRYGGLQILLRALLDARSLVLSDAHESINEFLERAASAHVTHISGTPSHWRRVVMSPAASKFTPSYVRLSGEIVDQGILDQLRALYPDAKIVHAFASTEAGVGFEVHDCMAGFPASVVEHDTGKVEIKIVDGSLRIRSPRTAIRYLGNAAAPIKDQDLFVDTRDMVELRGDRYHFIGRMDGVINVGGLKVHPEEIESVLNRHPSVVMSVAKARKNPITGAVVTADVVVKSDLDYAVDGTRGETLRAEILEICRRALAPYKVPAALRFVKSLDVAASGKLARV